MSDLDFAPTLMSFSVLTWVRLRQMASLCDINVNIYIVQIDLGHTQCEIQHILAPKQTMPFTVYILGIV